MPTCIGQLPRNHPVLHMAVTHNIALWLQLVAIRDFLHPPRKGAMVYMYNLARISFRFQLELLDGDVSSVPLRHDEGEV